MMWHNQLLKQLQIIVAAAPLWLRDFFKGFATGLAIGLPLFVVWLSFTHPKTFKLEYMKEVSLLVVWSVCLLQAFQLKSFEVGKDGFKFAFGTEGISPEKSVSK